MYWFDAHLSLYRHCEQLLAFHAVAAVGGVTVAVVVLGRPAAVLLDALPVDAEAEDGAHLAESGADLKRIVRRSKLIHVQARHD